MKRDEFIRLLQKDPFQPFRITTTDDEVIDIKQRQMVLVAGDDITVGVPDPVYPAPVASRLVWLGFDNILRAEPIQRAK
jgi:hypothetical protein